MTGASATHVHVATLRGQLWSPLCTSEVGWVVPLADRSFIDQVTCQDCLELAVTGVSGALEREMSQGLAYRVPLFERSGAITAWAVIDDGDADFISQYRWHLLQGYARTSIQRRSYSMHRMLLDLPRGRVPEVDHLNRVRTDNRRRNLRVATRRENNQNTDRFRGASFHQKSQRWQARVRLDGHLHHLGLHTTEAAASEVAHAFRAEHVPQVEAPAVVDITSLPILSAPARRR